LCVLAEAAAALGDREAATQLYADLQGEERYGDCVIVGAHIFFGAFQRFVGLVALTAGHANEAVAAHEAAVAVHERLAATGWAARSRYELARALVARRRQGDRRRAVGLAQDALATARALGMERLLAEERADPILG
jgi:hypothetical protein